MALTIEQKPLYTLNPVGQEVIFTVSDLTTVGAYFNVKYVAEVHISTVDIDLATTTAIVGTFKTTPNNTGVGMYDFRPILESFVSPDNLAALVSEYKGVPTTAITTHPLHLIDKYSLNDNVVRYLKIRFTIEGSSTATGTVAQVGAEDDSVQYTLINGYLKYTDVINRDATGNFGFNTGIFQLDAVASGRFLTNAPTTQYANINDYGTLSFMATPVTGSVSTSTVDYLKIILYDESGSQLGTDIEIENVDGNGGNTTWDSATKNQLLHLGCFPANLKNWSTVFLANMTDLSYYTIQAFTSVNLVMSELITININCPTLKGYEPIRLTWLNQWGVWDYYTFKMKSTKMISTKGSTYQQLEGTWNESIYLPNGYKGGKKAFRVNAMEKISMNTDFVNESESEWFEELINSPEVYILDGFQTDPTNPLLNNYVTPARLTTSSFTRKTVANDKLMQYTFEVEKSKTLRTQSV